MADYYEPIPELAKSEERDRASIELYKKYVMCLLSRARKGGNDTSSAERVAESPQQTTDSEDSTSSKNVVPDISTEAEISTTSVTNGEASSTNSGLATIHIDDKYICCRFCNEWDGKYDDKWANCNVFKEIRSRDDGKQCKYYETNKGYAEIHKLTHGAERQKEWPYMITFDKSNSHK